MFVFDWASYGSWSATWSRCGCSAVMCLQESVVPPSICWNMQALVLRPENRAGRLRAIQLSGSREMTTGIRSGGNPPEIQVGDSHAKVLDTFASCNHHGDADGVSQSALRGRPGHRSEEHTSALR